MKTPELPRGVSLHRGKLRIAFRPAGHTTQVKRSLGVPPTKANIRAAEIKLNAIRHDIMLGRFDIGDHFANDPLSAKTPYYLPDIYKDFYLSRAVDLKPSTQRSYQNFHRILTDYCSGLDGRNMSEAGGLETQKILIKHKINYATINKIMGMLRVAMNRAHSAKRVEHNPFISVEPLRGSRTREQLDQLEVYTIEEADKLISFSKTEERRRLLTFLFWSGIRHGEAAALERVDVSLPYITVRRNLTVKGVVGSPKTPSSYRTIMLPKKAQLALEEQLESHANERVWTRRHGEPFKTSRVICHKTYKLMCRDAGLRYLVPYRTRHSFISWMLAAGELPITVANHVGHKNTSTIEKVYSVFIPKNNPKWTLDDPAIFEEVKKSMKS